MNSLSKQINKQKCDLKTRNMALTIMLNSEKSQESQLTHLRNTEESLNNSSNNFRIHWNSSDIIRESCNSSGIFQN